eukprot:2814734-Rhodomonas_salina.1
MGNNPSGQGSSSPFDMCMAKRSEGTERKRQEITSKPKESFDTDGEGHPSLGKCDKFVAKSDFALAKFGCDLPLLTSVSALSLSDQRHL